MRFFLLIIILINSFNNISLLAQASSFLTSNQNILTNKYENEIVGDDEAIFSIFTTDESNANIIISKYDKCNNHIWTKKVTSSFDLKSYEAIIHNKTLLILFVTHFNSSVTRTPILLNLNYDGEIIFSYRYQKESFENFINLTVHDKEFHLMGPSSGTTNGGGHFCIDESGDILYANILNYKKGNNGINFGSGVLNNGTVIRRHNNVLIACDQNQNIIWAKRFVNHSAQAFLEKRPLSLNDGFIHILKSHNEIIIFKMDFDGKVIWARKGNGSCFNTAPILINNNIGFIWESSDSDNLKKFTYTELNSDNGSVITNSIIDNNELNLLEWPDLDSNINGDLFLSGSIDEDIKKDLIIINPMQSDCINTLEGIELDIVDLIIEDIIDEYEIINVEAYKEEVTLTIADIENFLEPQCNSIIQIEIDTFLNCQGTLVFDGSSYGREFLWTDGSTDSIRIFTETQKTSVLIYECGLTYEIVLNIKNINCDCQIFTPNIIMDHSFNFNNQSFSVKSNCTFDYYSMLIYDRWGNVVFRSNDDWINWDPKNLNQGVYSWLLHYKIGNSTEIQIATGDITYIK